MEKSNIMIRLEKKEEYQKVENLVRESFWNVYRPGCLEHYVQWIINPLPDAKTQSRNEMFFACVFFAI